MKALIGTLAVLFSMQNFSSQPVDLEVETRSTNGKVIVHMKNPSSDSLICFSKLNADGMKKRTIASSKTYSFSAYESRSMIYESNFEAVELKDLSLKCVTL
jgi:hypothetical protein